MSIRRIERPLSDPYCWNCGTDPGGRQLVTVREAAEFCGVSINAVYRWMEQGLVEWIYNAGGRRRIYKDTLVRDPGDEPVGSEKSRDSDVSEILFGGGE